MVGGGSPATAVIVASPSVATTNFSRGNRVILFFPVVPSCSTSNFRGQLGSCKTWRYVSDTYDVA